MHETLYATFVEEKCSVSIQQRQLAFGFKRGLKISRDYQQENEHGVSELIQEEGKLFLFSSVNPIPDGVMEFIHRLDIKELPERGQEQIFEFRLKHDLILNSWELLKEISFDETTVRPGIEVN